MRGASGGEHILAETLGENEFHRFPQFQLPVLLFPKSVRQAKALPPKMQSPQGHCGKMGEMHIIFSANCQRKIHAGRTETQIIISKLLVGNQINAWGFKNEWANVKAKIIYN